MVKKDYKKIHYDFDKVKIGIKWICSIPFFYVNALWSWNEIWEKYDFFFVLFSLSFFVSVSDSVLSLVSSCFFWVLKKKKKKYLSKNRYKMKIFFPFEFSFFASVRLRA